MRLLFTTTNVSSGGSAVQISSDSMGRIIAFTFRARVGNGARVFIGNSSVVSSAGSGYSISSTGTFPPDGSMFAVPSEHGKPKGFAPSSLWMNASASSTDRLDGAFLIEP